MTTVDAPASAAEQMRQEKDSNFVVAGQILCVIVPLVIWFSPIGLAPQIKHGFAILAFMVIAWITQATEFACARARRAWTDSAERTGRSSHDPRCKDLL
jgi:hypothetical protein